MWQQLKSDIQKGNIKALARCISLVENEAEGYEELLASLSPSKTPIIGITGPPGAGKSTLVDALIGEFVAQNKKVAVVCVDPSSPFNLGALLGDSIRLSEWYNNTNVYIRSIGTRGSLGGLSAKIIEICDVLKESIFDYIIVETVGVGQSEIEIVGLADCTVVVLVPEAGDEIQTMKAGLMEIANVFVVNKADRPDAKTFVNNLRQMLAPAFKNSKNEIEIIATSAINKEGVSLLYTAILNFIAQTKENVNEEKIWLLTQRLYNLIQKKRMKNVDKEQLKTSIKTGNTTIYNLLKNY